MNNIWANVLIAGSKTWNNVPQTRKKAVKAILAERVKNSEITAGDYTRITGEDYVA